MRVASLWLLVFLFPSMIIAQEIPIQVVDSGGQQLHTLQSLVQRGTYYFDVEDLFLLFDPQGGQRYIPLTKRLTLRLRDKRFDLSVTRKQGKVDGQPFRLAHAPLLVDEAGPDNRPIIRVPVDFITDVVGPALDYVIDFNPNAQRLQVREAQVSVPFQATNPEMVSLALILDPGHGGQDAGARGTTGIVEKDVTLAVARQASAFAESIGLPVYLTRTEDKTVSSLARAQAAIWNRGGLLISIHCNRSFLPNESGVRIFINNPEGNLAFGNTPGESNTSEESMPIQEVSQAQFLVHSKQVAEALKQQLQESLDVPVADIVELPLQSLMQVMMPAILLEVGFLSNPLDQTRLTDPSQLEALTQVLVNTVQQFLD